MAADRDTILSWLADLSAAIVTDAEDTNELASRLEEARTLTADAFALEAMSLMRIIAESVSDPEGFDSLATPVSVSGRTLDAVIVLIAMALSIAGGRPDWPSRPKARKARERLSEAGDAATQVASGMGGDGADLFGWLTSIVSTSCRLISERAADAAPIVKVETGISLPSTVLAHQLYGDANRADSLVEIAGATTPLVMPTFFDALAS